MEEDHYSEETQEEEDHLSEEIQEEVREDPCTGTLFQVEDKYHKPATANS